MIHLFLALTAALFTPQTGPELSASVASARATPEADVIRLACGATYSVPVHPAYRVALILDGISGLAIEGPKVCATPPVIRIAPSKLSGQAIVLFGSGRTAGTSSIAIRRVVLDGSDRETVGEDTQQSSLFRAFSVAGLELEDVEIRNIAADGIKLAGTSRYGSTRRVRINRVTSSDTGRAAIVLQSLIEDIEIRQLVTTRQRKAAIDGESTLPGFPGPQDVRILDSILGASGECGLQLGGTGSGEESLRGVLVSRTQVSGCVWVRSAEGLIFVDVTADSKRFGLWLDKSVRNLDWYGGRISGLLAAVQSTHHGAVGAVPSNVRFLGTEFSSPPSVPTVRVISGELHSFEGVIWPTGGSLQLVNELAGQPMSGFEVRGSAPKVVISSRTDRPTSPISPVEIIP